jgi:hypothetical protein
MGNLLSGGFGGGGGDDLSRAKIRTTARACAEAISTVTDSQIRPDQFSFQQQLDDGTVQYSLVARILFCRQFASYLVVNSKKIRNAGQRV